MADISKCIGVGIALCKGCYRKTARINPFAQAYTQPPNQAEIDRMAGGCLQYIRDPRRKAPAR